MILSENSSPQAIRAAGAIVFKHIVRDVIKRTGQDYTAVFNRVLPANRDLLDGSYFNRYSTEAMVRLMNRAESALGLSYARTASQVKPKISRLVNRAFPHLDGWPAHLQWDCIQRTITQLEKAGVPTQLFNRAVNLPSADWQRAEQLAPDVLEFLENDTPEIDMGNSSTFQKLDDIRKQHLFKNHVYLLTKTKGLTTEQAFNQLKDDQPVFWAACVMAFQPIFLAASVMAFQPIEN